ncbi:hypothetical protein M2451_003213 [Dysgonomonas sp. PFB1-18]|uniref:RteC domain-containing protein n=1 Tax=unclassified Dysgonomonas TaxID=2630389 RepID=UPI0013D4132A|nr:MULTISPECIES: RteC domain-containing protein [unclassified Dysgonomonas]MDL2302792.1 RteC domain-containing protein [Dysgonomonas sp. OttesenSCG-928-D17]MDH6310326.1 hypothetical protein [Dysgonomonas sp. PF1-14]MDH6340344.1 hypothetical protein [Dysgonomonas sp. PF1-16]MDH6381876.1 hypothetical protein [Dysgonomonas sp. PFB1-18]MDH6399315.1 hypothetical protein [Dysgonomonas sp. PF1-23]
MKQYTYELSFKINQELKEIECEEENIFNKAPKIISLLENTFIELKEFICTYKFKNIEEEIHFFKEIKPQLFSKLIYNRKIYCIETMIPNGSIESQNAYLRSEQDHLKIFFDRNLDFYKYYRTGCTHLDRYYFVRGKPDIQLNLDTFYFERDPKFSTSFDFKVSKIIANEMLAIYLNEKLKALNNSPNSSNFSSVKKKLTWTAKKTELVEQIYAWERAECFDYGNTNIKEIAEYVEEVFNIDLGDFYHAFLEIRERKGSRTIFLDKLIKFLNERMDELDNK